MLTKKAFEARHRQKFDRLRLSPSQRAQRYEDYLASTKAAKPAKKRQPVQRALRAQMGPQLSECSAAYAHAVVDPFAATVLPCIPDNIAIPSYKLRTYARGTMTTGLTGVGYVTVDPWMSATSNVCGWTTNKDYPLTQYTSPNDSTVGLTPVYSNSPLPQADFGDDGYSGRLVASGIRIRYTGPELTRAGLAVTYRMPNNKNIPTSTVENLLVFQEAATTPVDRKWAYSMHRPAIVDDLAYDNGNYALLEYSMLVYVSGATPQTSFEYELVSFHELTGAKLPNLTPSSVDPIGMALVTTALPAAQPSSTPNATWEAFKKHLTQVASATLTHAATSAVRYMLPGVPAGPLIEDL